MTVMTVYFLIATSHIFFIPQQNAIAFSSNLTGNSIFNRKSEIFTANSQQQKLVQRPDKSTLEDKRTIRDAIKSMVSFFIVLLFMPIVWQLKPDFCTNEYKWAHLPRHTFLSLGIIKI